VKTNSGLLMCSLAISCLTAALPITASDRDSRLRPKGIVMSPGSQIAAKTPYGTISITAKDTLTRLYAWAGGKRSVLMWRRDATNPRAFGIYNPTWYKDEFWLLPSMLGFNDTVHGVSEENFANFESVEKALNWLFLEPGAVRYIWRNDGLCVWYRREQHIIGVNVFQIYINGKKPNKLPGATDHLIETIGGTSPTETDQPVDSGWGDGLVKKGLDRIAAAIREKPTAKNYVEIANRLTILGRYNEALEACDKAEQLNSLEDGIESMRNKAMRRKSMSEKLESSTKNAKNKTAPSCN